MTWSEPVTVFKGTGPASARRTPAVFYDKEWITVDNNPGSPFYGRAYLTTSRFLNGLQGSYAESPIWLSWSDDGGLHVVAAEGDLGIASELHVPDERRRATDCDEDQFSIPEVASDGTLYVHFLNGQNEAAWEVAGGPRQPDHGRRGRPTAAATFGDPVPAAQLEDGFSDMPWSVIGRTDRLGSSDPLDRRPATSR